MNITMAETTQNTEQTTPEVQLEGGTYEIIRSRLLAHGKELRSRISTLNESRKAVFGSIESKLVSTDRISTQNNCVARDIFALDDICIFGYNVHIGLRAEIKISDVFSVYSYNDRKYSQQDLSLLGDEKFNEDFKNLYKYYRDTVFAKFTRQGNFLFMVFRIGKNSNEIKAFKWAIQGGKLIYVDNRSDHEVRFPDQHEFQWKRAHRDMHREGKFPHVSLDDRVFVETIGGTLTIKVEDNTEDGKGIYSEPVSEKEQRLDDAEYFYADLGNIIALKIRPFNEKKYRYLAFNEKVQEVRKVPALEDSCVLLPDDHGIIFANGYYLQTGEFKIFDTGIEDLRFERRVQSPNGEDYLYVFYQEDLGVYVLLSYNLIAQQVDTPIICHGFCFYENGELCYFKAEDEPQKHHALQIWQTPYVGPNYEQPVKEKNFLFKIGNKDIVRAMAECTEVLTLLNKEDSYGNLYLDLVRKTGDILDSYYWLSNKETFQLNEPLKGIRESAQGAIEEFEKVQRIRKHTQEETERVQAKVNDLKSLINRSIFDTVDQFVKLLANLREARGEVVSLKELRYVNLDAVEKMGEELAEKTDKLSQQCVEFLLREDALDPYHKMVAQQQKNVGGVTTATEAAKVEEEIDGVGRELELLIEIVSNLKIADATKTTAIIDSISNIYAELNQVRAGLRQRKKELLGKEAVAEFGAQIKLIEQAVVNYMDVSDSPEKCDEYLNKLMVQIEELEGKFAEFDEFVEQLAERREEIYNAFDSRKLQLVEARNRRAASLFKSAERILKGIRNRVSGLDSVQEINGYYASDLMIDKIRDIIDQLKGLEDNVKAEDLATQLKTIREDAVRQLKDRKELFVDGKNVIRLGKHAFSVNTQNLDLTVVQRDNDMFFHLTGTSFFEKITQADFLKTREVWDMEVISENEKVYRGEFLAYAMLVALEHSNEPNAIQNFLEKDETAQLKAVQEFMGPRYNEGYAKGIHDRDGLKILQALAALHADIRLLRYLPEARALARLYWDGFAPDSEKKVLEHRLKGAGYILKVFPETREFGHIIKDLGERMAAFCETTGLFPVEIAQEAGEYLFHEISRADQFVVSPTAYEIVRKFSDFLTSKRLKTTYSDSLKNLKGNAVECFELVRNWINAFAHQEKVAEIEDYLEECTVLLYFEDLATTHVQNTPVKVIVEGLSGDHEVIQEGKYALDYNHFLHKLRNYTNSVVPQFNQYNELKKELTEDFRQELRLDEFKPRVLTSFVRNKLLDEVYLPLIGDNLAKQIGSTGDNKRTDTMGMLLLISPPGYGKTTLMEYVANRLGLIFMKINGPAIGHQVTSVDPTEAPNAAAREELQKLNLAFEMGDNIMIYIDDIQHCNPEFLQKFISLCDAQRKIEGVYKGRPRTYDLRGKRVCVVMAGNPYTESGEKFQIPDMLANRADTYNLGDIIGDTADTFKLSYVENCLTSNATLAKIASRSHKDVHAFLKIAETDQREGIDFEGNYTPEEMNEIISVLKKLMFVRDVILKVNQQYIASAAQADAYRTEPAFKLQGSYRDMNKIAEKIIPIMNDAELRTLLMSHYESESQTLTTGAEANLLKFKELVGWLNEADTARWDDIKATFRKKQKMLGLDSGDRMGQVISQLGDFTEQLEGIRKALEK